MIVSDTSALLSLTIADSLDLSLTEFDVHTTTIVVGELEETGTYDDVHAEAAEAVLGSLDDMTVHDVTDVALQSSRIDEGEASCLALAKHLGPRFLITDDLRALPELQSATDARVVISPLLLRALVERDVLTPEEVATRLRQLATTRDWLGAPIYRKAQELFDDVG